MTNPTQTMPQRVYLCPVHFEHWYMPDNGGICPELGCDREMVEFTRGPVCKSCMDSGIRHYADPECTPENDPCPDCCAGVPA